MASEVTFRKITRHRYGAKEEARNSEWKMTSPTITVWNARISVEIEIKLFKLMKENFKWFLHDIYM